MLSECPCGSGEFPYILYDARGIACGHVCTKCEAAKKATYRPEVFTETRVWNGNENEFGEQIEPD